MAEDTISHIPPPLFAPGTERASEASDVGILTDLHPGHPYRDGPLACRPHTVDAAEARFPLRSSR